MKILIMGLPGSGKTYLAERLQPLLHSAWYNADQVRKMANDWDFSTEGRLRQSLRMKSFADFEKSHSRFVICDFICPTKQEIFSNPISLYLWTLLKREDLKIPIKYLKTQTVLTFILKSGMKQTTQRSLIGS
jgi:adenylate kinase family enzyme